MAVRGITSAPKTVLDVGAAILGIRSMDSRCMVCTQVAITHVTQPDTTPADARHELRDALGAIQNLKRADQRARKTARPDALSHPVLMVLCHQAGGVDDRCAVLLALGHYDFSSAWR